MAKLFRQYMASDEEIIFEYDLDEKLPIWGETFTMGDKGDEDFVKVTVGKKLYDKSGIAAFEVLASREVRAESSI